MLLNNIEDGFDVASEATAYSDQVILVHVFNESLVYGGGAVDWFHFRWHPWSSSQGDQNQKS